MTSPPIIAPITTPIPPAVEAPPIKHAAIASNSKPIPALGVATLSRAAKTSPERAANTPILTKTQNTMRCVFTPDNFAAFSLPPSA